MPEVKLDLTSALWFCHSMKLSHHYLELVSWLSGSGATPDTVLHIHGGMAIMLFVRLITGQSLATPWPLLAVVIAAFAKEFADILVYEVVKPDTFSDIAHTVFWPSVLFVGIRARPTDNVKGWQSRVWRSDR